MKKIISLLSTLFILFCLRAQDTERARALDLLSRGDRHIEREEYGLAREVFSEARAFFEKRGDCRETAYCYLWLGEAAYGEGQYEEALRLGLQAEATAERCAGRDTFAFYSLILQNIGVFYSRLGDFDRQMAYYQSAFEHIMRREGRRSERGADAYFNMGAAFGRRGHWEKSIAYFDTSLQIARAINYREGIAPLYLNLSYAYQIKKDYIRAIEYQEKALKLSTRQQELGRGYNNLGMLYSDLGDRQRALYYLGKARELRRGIYPSYHDDVLSTQLNISRVYFEAGRLASADSLIEEVIRSLRSPAASDKAYLKVAYHYKAVLEQRMGRLDEAERYAREAMVLDGRQLRIEGSTRLILAGILLERGSYQQALAQIQAGLAGEITGFPSHPEGGNPPLSQIENTGMVLDLLAMKAQILSLRGTRQGNSADLSASLATFNLIDSLIAYSRRTFQDNRSKELLAASVRDLYAGAVAAAYSLYRVSGDTAYFDLAFRYSEKNRSLLVLEKIHDLYAKEFYGLPPGMVERERRLLQDIEFLTNQIRENPSSPAISGMQNRLFDLRRQQEELLDALRRDYPEYYALKHEPVSATPWDIRNQLLAEKEVFLEYFQAGNSLYIFLIDRNRRELIRVSVPGDLGVLTGAFRQSVTGQEDSFYEKSHNLYRLLLAPVERLIKGKDLVIIPDGVLGYIPFEALLYRQLGPGETGNHRVLPYVIRRNGIRYAFSASLMLAGRSLNRKGSGRVLGLAPVFSRPDLPSLPGSQEEMELLEKRFRGHFWRRDEALESRLKASGSGYDLLHIATHTLINEAFPSLSKLVLTAPDPKGEDGYLNAYELYNLRLNAALVVLSACNTGTGAIQQGEGIASLARAFAYAGCPNLMFSLWPVRDRTTARLMAYYYDNLAAGKDKSQALREAKLSYLDQENELFLHPFYWAAFTYSGDRQPLHLKNRRQGPLQALPLVFAVAALGIAAAIWSRRRL